MPDLSPAREHALACVLDEIVPPSADGRLPGAGELGLARPIFENTPDMALVIEQGLSALDELARGRGAEDFAGVPREDRAGLLNGLATTQPAFVPGLMFQTYVGYYQHPRVVEALGIPPRPPHPVGYDLEAGDLSLLDRVRARPRLYREV